MTWISLPPDDDRRLRTWVTEAVIAHRDHDFARLRQAASKIVGRGWGPTAARTALVMLGTLEKDAATEPAEHEVRAFVSSRLTDAFNAAARESKPDEPKLLSVVLATLADALPTQALPDDYGLVMNLVKTAMIHVGSETAHPDLGPHLLRLAAASWSSQLSEVDDLIATAPPTFRTPRARRLAVLTLSHVIGSSMSPLDTLPVYHGATTYDADADPGLITDDGIRAAVLAARACEAWAQGTPQSAIERDLRCTPPSELPGVIIVLARHVAQGVIASRTGTHHLQHAVTSAILDAAVDAHRKGILTEFVAETGNSLPSLIASARTFLANHASPADDVSRPQNPPRSAADAEVLIAQCADVMAPDAIAVHYHAVRRVTARILYRLGRTAGLTSPPRLPESSPPRGTRPNLGQRGWDANYGHQHNQDSAPKNPPAPQPSS